MYHSDVRFIQPFLDEFAQISADHSNPIPLSFFASLSAALTIGKNSYLPSAPIASPNGVTLGRLLAKAWVKSPIEVKLLATLKHSKLTTFTNVAFKQNESEDLYNPYSRVFKTRFLLTTPTEWRTIVYSRKLRALRGEGYSNIAETLYNRLSGKLPYYISPETLLYYAEQLLALYVQATADIRLIDNSKRNAFVDFIKKDFLVTTCYPHIQNTIPVLETILHSLKSSNALPVLSQGDLISISDIIANVPEMVRSLPMHQGLLRCLYPYIADLVDERIILPVCPAILDSGFNVIDRKQSKNDIHLTSLAESEDEGVSSDSTPEAPEPLEAD